MDAGRLHDHVHGYLDRLGFEGELRALLDRMLAYEAKDRPRLDTLAERLEDLADEEGGTTLVRWCRKHDWEDGAIIEGELSGRSITESRLSAQTLGEHVAVPKPEVTTGSLSDRTFQYEAGAATFADAMLPSMPPASEPAPAAVEPPAPRPIPITEVSTRPSRPAWVWGVAGIVLLGVGAFGVLGGGAAMLGGAMLLGGDAEEAVAEVPEPPPEPVPEAPAPAPTPGPAAEPVPGPVPDDGVATPGSAARPGPAPTTSGCSGPTSTL